MTFFLVKNHLPSISPLHDSVQNNLEIFNLLWFIYHSSDLSVISILGKYFKYANFMVKEVDKNDEQEGAKDTPLRDP